MAFMLSPGVQWNEIDLTTIVPAVGTTEGAFVGDFAWGPIDQIVTIGNEAELVKTFWKPSSNTFVSFYTAANFLAYARSLRTVRAANTAIVKNATSSSNTALLIKNRNVYDSAYIDMSAGPVYGMYAARYAGALGNSLKVATYCGSNTILFDTWVYQREFDSAPGTSVYCANQLGANDEMHIMVIDEDGKFSGEANTVVEKFPFVSKARDAKNDDGSSNYYVNVLRDRSKFIYALNHAQSANGQAETTTWGLTANTNFVQTNPFYHLSLAGGLDAAPTTGQLQLGYDRFLNADEVDISLVLTGGHPQVVSEYVVDNLAEARRDCVAFISPGRSDVVNNDGAEVDAILTTRDLYNSSSYAVMDCNWKLQFDKYNNLDRWVPLNGDIAGLCVRTDFERDPWYSPAGFNRGHIKNVVRLAWSPDQADRDDLYKAGVNPVCAFKGEGVILYGDKTMLAKPSAFDRINVRRLFIVLEKAISRAARYSLFEFNDEFTRAQFVSLIEPFLRDVKGRRGIFDFRVVCDTTNNTPEVIDRNEFIGDIYIKPARSINFITLNFVAVRTGVAFEEIVGRF
jgi:hypothetical protein